MNGPAHWKIRRTPDGHVAIVRFRTGDGPNGIATVSAIGADEGDALARAAVLAKQITESPIFAAVAPPGTAAAIKAISAIAKSKDVRAALSRYAGPGARRLASALAKTKYGRAFKRGASVIRRIRKFW